MKFEPKYVRCMWSEEMKGNRCFVSDRISDLERIVEEGLLDSYGRVEPTGSRDFPFQSNGSLWRFAYFDPYFTLKQAREEGKTIERFWKSENEWEEWTDDEFPGDLSLYRIKPEEEKPVTNRELSLWMAHGNGELYYCIDEDRRAKYFTGFQRYPDAIRKPPTCFTDFPYHPDEGDKPVCNVVVRKWEDTEWHTPTREYMGLEE